MKFIDIYFTFEVKVASYCLIHVFALVFMMWFMMRHVNEAGLIEAGVCLIRLVKVSDFFANYPRRNHSTVVLKQLNNPNDFQKRTCLFVCKQTDDKLCYFGVFNLGSLP